MQRYANLLVILSSLLLISAPLFAGEYSAKIKKIAELYDSMEYEKCLKEINELEGRRDSLKKGELVEVYKYKAFIYILSDRKALAEVVIKEIYEIEPEFTLSPSVSPKLREPFARIKKEIKKEDKWEGGRVIEAKAVNPNLGDRVTIVAKEGVPEKKGEFFKENIIPMSIVGVGVALLVPGMIVRLSAASDAEEYRQKLDGAQRDELGNIIGITRGEAEGKQEEIDNKVILGNTLLSIGCIGIIGGITSYFVLEKMRKVDNKKKVSIVIDGERIVISGSYEF